MLSSKSMKNGLLRILNDLDSAGRGKKRDEEEGGTRWTEERGGKRDEEEGATRIVKKRLTLSVVTTSAIKNINIQ